MAAPMMLRLDRAVPLDDFGGLVGTEIYQQRAAWRFIGLHGNPDAGLPVRGHVQTLASGHPSAEP
jgi:hypothetical protein